MVGKVKVIISYKICKDKKISSRLGTRNYTQLFEYS